jgi:hypothetical protein
VTCDQAKEIIARVETISNAEMAAVARHIYDCHTCLAHWKAAAAQSLAEDTNPELSEKIGSERAEALIRDEECRSVLLRKSK